MAVDTEFISEKSFNTKFKNYLRDFYVYQFKHKDMDFYDMGKLPMARMAAGSIFCTCTEADVQSCCKMKMKDITICDDSVEITVSKVKYTLERPLSEIFRFLYSGNKSVYFLTGHEVKPNEEKLHDAIAQFKKECGSRTPEMVYRYWSEIFLRETQEAVTAGSFYNDSSRIEVLIGRMAGVIWSNGSKIDYISREVREDEIDSCVGCVTADTRTVQKNPFHTLYGYCGRYNGSSKGDHFSLIYALLLYFQIGKTVKRNDVNIPNGDWMDELSYHLGCVTAIYEGADSNGTAKKFDLLSESDKQIYAYRAIERFMKSGGTIGDEVYGDDSYAKAYEDTGLTDVYSYIVNSRKKIVLENGRFRIRDNTDDCVELKCLFEYYASLGHRHKVDQRQFKNIIKELERTGVISEKKDLILYNNRKSTTSAPGKAVVCDVIRQFSDCGAELTYEVAGGLYEVRYSADADANRLKNLVKALRDFCKGWTLTFTDKVYYKLSDAFLSDLLGDDGDLIRRFFDMVSFFSQTMALGEVGGYISDRMPAADSIFRYKHNYIIKALNDYNISDLLYAVKNGLWADIECRDALEHKYQRFVCYPIEIRENVYDGKQFLVYYHPGYRSVSSVPVEFIDRITLGSREEAPYFGEDINRAKKLIESTWGVNFGDFFEGNVKSDFSPSRVKVVIKYDPVHEKYIRARIKREIRNGSFTETDVSRDCRLAEITVSVVNPFDMLHWIRSYTTRIVSIDFGYHGFNDDVLRSHETYKLPTKESILLSPGGSQDMMLEAFDPAFTPADSMHDRLFNEIYSVSFTGLGDILFDMLGRRTVDEKYIAGRKEDYARLIGFKSRDKRKAQAEGFIRDFCCEGVAGNPVSPVFSLTANSRMRSIKDIIPLTHIEIQWLDNILASPHARCFLDDAEINRLRSALPRIGWFDVNDVKIADQFANVTSPGENHDYVIHMRKLMNAIHRGKCVNIEYVSQYGKPLNAENCAPAYIEYSKKDNKFRLQCVCGIKGGYSKIQTLNLERMCGVIETEHTFDVKSTIAKVTDNIKNSTKRLVVYFNDCEGVPDRILSEFSYYKKECIKWGNGKYRMTLYYVGDDYKEIIIRLLSYGSLVTVGEDTGSVLKEMKERLKNQLVLSRIIEDEKAEQFPDKIEEIDR